MIMSSPSATLALWAGSWLAGSSAPDDVVEALHEWASQQLVAAGDPVTAGETGLPWQDGVETGVIALLKTFREASASGEIRLVLPAAGDVRGLPAGTDFARAAVSEGNGILIGRPGEPGTGLVPHMDQEDVLQWTVFSVVVPLTAVDEMSLGEAEYSMREAVRDAADALMAVHSVDGGAAGAPPRDLIEDELHELARYRYPATIPDRSRRVLDAADHVAAILTVAEREPTSSAASATGAAVREQTLRPLWAAVRAARMAAVRASLQKR